MFSRFLRYLIVFIAVYSALLLLSTLPICQEGLSPLFQTGAKYVLESTMPETYWVIHQHPNSLDPEHIRILFESTTVVEEQTEKAKQLQLTRADITFQSYQIFLREFWILPTLYLFAMVIISPTRRPGHTKQKTREIVKALAWKVATLLLAGLLYFIYTLLRLYCIMLHQTYIKGVGETVPNEWMLARLESLQLFMQSITAAFIVATFVWIAILFTGNNWKQLIDSWGLSAQGKTANRK